ncbi:branched-chain amino acid transport system II carrier protein [Robiginitalea marina]|uniref:Branched-chain amino acid transport system II carrier protein n=1 Tax=Robiginitalea marina TaxID=2954105 RepID=A0ABT1AWA3_9FLAO|nr:branched-chain amino acid transport system II carrier protein [Robiginitalea marina]MCO5724330.1 branched-chain amino acid transport system II carrier protein [Robiginitalea marina]
MKRSADWILALALFSLFFGAGNLILPPQLGYRSGALWWLTGIGFSLSAVLIPMLGILAHARLQGGMYDFGRKVSPAFSLGYCFLVYGISIALPSPRTASVTHEMAIAPFFGTPSLLTSLVYFALVYLLVIRRSQIAPLIGKLLTPAILLVLLLLIGSVVFLAPGGPGPVTIAHPLSEGLLEGYQTFDAIGAVVVGGVILVSLNLEHPGLGVRERFLHLSRAGWLAGLGLFLLYAGLLFSGALLYGSVDGNGSRTEILRGMSTWALGHSGNIFLSILISLACFTTAVGIITGTADFMQSRFRGSSGAYRLTALAGCALGVLMGQLPVDYIIAVALPALMFIYPLTIALIVLNALPGEWSPPGVFKIVVFTVLVFSVPPFLQSVGWDAAGDWGSGWLPLEQYQMGWVLPGIVAFAAGHLLVRSKP